MKASFNISSYPADVQVILRAMKKYGIMLADNGSAWYISGAPDNRWNDDNLQTLGQLRGSKLTTTFVSATQLTATGNAPTAKPSVPVVVSTPDNESSSAVYVAVTAPAQVAVTISPTSTTLRVTRTKQFSASVRNSADKAVIWKVNGITGGSAALGTITSSGLYRAPNAVPKPAVVTVSATAAADQTKSATASVTIRRR